MRRTTRRVKDNVLGQLVPDCLEISDLSLHFRPGWISPLCICICIKIWGWMGPPKINSQSSEDKVSFWLGFKTRNPKVNLYYGRDKGQGFLWNCSVRVSQVVQIFLQWMTNLHKWFKDLGLLVVKRAEHKLISTLHRGDKSLAQIYSEIFCSNLPILHKVW